MPSNDHIFLGYGTLQRSGRYGNIGSNDHAIPGRCGRAESVVSRGYEEICSRLKMSGMKENLVVLVVV